MFSLEILDALFGHFCESVTPPAFVFFECRRSENLCRLAACNAAKKIHLPKTIACGLIALLKIEVRFVLRFDVGNPASIVFDNNTRAQTGLRYDFRILCESLNEKSRHRNEKGHDRTDWEQRLFHKCSDKS